MAIIYTYPTKATLALADKVLISDSADGNKTKNATITSIKDAIDVVDSLTAGSGISLTGSSLPTGDITIANTGVLSISSDNTALTTSGSSAVTLTSTPYGGGSTIGHVPAGGTAGNYLDGAGTWSTIDLTTDVNGILPAENGGLGGGVFNNGDLVYYTGSAFTRLATNGVTDNYVLTAVSGVPTWALNPGGGSGPGTGTQYNLPIWSTTSTLGDSLITQNAGATVLNVGTNIASFSTVAGVGSVFTTRVSVNGYSTFGGKLKLSSPDGATSVEIEGPANGGAAYTVKMPSSLGTANQVLKLPSTIPGSGASQLVWGDATGGVTYTFSTGLSESGGTVTLDAGLNNLTNVSFATGANSSLYVGQISPVLSGTPLGNVTLGGGAAKVATTAFDNTLVGSDAAALITEGSANVAIGSDVAATLTTGTNNVIIGDSANILGATLSSTTVIGQGASGAADSTVIGKGASASTNGTAIGSGASASGGGIAIGKDATAAANEIELNGITSSIVATTGNTAAGDLKITINGTVYYIALRTYAP